jgi:hypothetical protein
MLFNLEMSEIARVKLIRAHDNESFVLSQAAGNEFSLFSYPEMHPAIVKDSLAIRYLAGFFHTPFERFANSRELPLFDSLAGATPDFYMNVSGHNGESRSVSFHKIIQQDGSYDVFRLHALINDGNDMVIIPWHSVDLLLRSRSYFNPESSTR